MADVVVDDEENAEDKPSGGGGNMNLNVTISDIQLPLVLMLSSSTVQLIAVMTWKATEIKWREYAISVPSVGMGLSAIGLLMTLKEALYKEGGKWLNQFLFVWNFVGACFLTFSSPFVFTGNVSLCESLHSCFFGSDLRGVGTIVHCWTHSSKQINVSLMSANSSSLFCDDLLNKNCFVAFSCKFVQFSRDTLPVGRLLLLPPWLSDSRQAPSRPV